MHTEKQEVNTIHSNCVVCGSLKIGPLDTYQNAHLSKCGNCKMVFSSRVPSGQELDNYYANYNRSRGVSELTLKKYGDLLDQFESYRELNRLLDAGCGSGFFLDIAKQKGWQSEGTEIGTETVEFCRKKRHIVYEGSIENIKFGEEYDLIASFEVIEHLIDPISHLQRLYDILRPGGVLYVTTPNFNAITRHLLKSEWTVITYPEHLSYFSAHTLDSALKRVGFKKLYMKADGISVDRLRNSLRKKKGSNKAKSTQSDKTSKPVISNESIRQASENNVLVKNLRKMIDGGLNITKSGEFLKGFYQKPMA
jgi:2-polyprenyl-3-methyl-5-hydroxy-6-metoxy-1,4-benzoquinol methylase